MKKIRKIVLTGGPCSGKTTLLSAIKNHFSKQFLVYTLPEVATLTITSGVDINPKNHSHTTNKNLTKERIKFQINLEKYYENISKSQKKETLIICDRGTLDSFAYTDKKTKTEILKSENWNYNYLCNNRYDLVVHLVTAAQGAEKYYTLANNKARSESLEEARVLDGLIAEEWIDHHNMKIIDNSIVGFEAKVDRVVKLIGSEVGVIIPRFHKKYLLGKKISEADLRRFLTVKVFSFVDFIFFLENDNGKRICWIVKRYFKKRDFFNFFIVDRVMDQDPVKRVQTQRTLNRDIYLEFLKKKKSGKSEIVRETHSFILKKNNESVVCSVENVFVSGKEKFILRVHRDSEKNDDLSILPDFFEIEEDISQNPVYFTKNLDKL